MVLEILSICILMNVVAHLYYYFFLDPKCKASDKHVLQ